MTGGQGGSQQPKRTFALRSNVHAPTGAVATVARCRADKGAPLSRAMVAVDMSQPKESHGPKTLSQLLIPLLMCRHVLNGRTPLAVALAS